MKPCAISLQAGLRATPRGGGGGGGHDEAAWLWAFATVLSRAFRLPRADLPPSPGGSGAAVDVDGGDADDRGEADALGGRGGSDLVVLCPLADLLNHGRAAPETASEWYCDARTGRVGARAGGAGRAAGRECRINYGAKSNDALLLNYGFVEEDNPDDVYEFEVRASSSRRGRSRRPETVRRRRHGERRRRPEASQRERRLASIGAASDGGRRCGTPG